MTRHISRRRRTPLLLATAHALLLPAVASAANGTWISTTPGGSWSTAANWSAGAVASGADATADFSTLNLTADLTVHLDSARTIGQLLLADTIPSNNWTIDNNFNTANTLSMVSTGTPTINVVNQTLTLSLGLTGSQIVTKTGTGALILNNSYDDTSLGMNAALGPLTLAKASSASVHAIGGNGLTISGSYVSLAGTGGDQIYDFANVNLTAGAFDTAGLSESFNSLSLAGTGFNSNVGALLNSASAPSTLTLSSLVFTANSTVGVSQAAGSLTLSAPVSGSFGLTKVGSGTLTLAGSSANTFTGPLTVNDGTINLNKPIQVAAFAGDLTIGDGVGNPNSASVVLLSTGQFGFPHLPNITLNTDGLLNLQNSGDVFGNVIMTGGTITSSNFSYLAGNVSTLASNATATISASVNLYTGTLGPNHTFTVADGPAAIDLDIPGTLNGTLYADPMIKSGPGTLRLSAANPLYSFTLNAGTVAVANDGALGTSSPVTVTGGTLQSDTAAHSLANPITLSGALTVAGPLNLSLAGVISGTGGITKIGTATLTLAGFPDNTYTGMTTVADGTLNLSKTNNIAALAGNITVGDGAGAPNSATLACLHTFQFGFNNFPAVTIYPDGLLDLQSSTEYVGNITMTAGSITNTNFFYHNGNLTTLASAASAALSGSGVKLIGSFGQVHTYTVADGPAPYDLDISAAVDGTSYNNVLLKTGPGTMRLSNSNTLFGITLTAGTLAVANDNAIGPSGTLVLNGGTIVADGAARTLANPVTLQADSTVSGSNPLTLTGPISGSAALTKSGTASLTLSGSNSFTGTLLVSAGSVILSGGSLATPSVLNQSSFIYNAGSFAGRLTNGGSVTFNADFTAGNGIENDSTLTVDPARTITLNGAGLDNQGTLNLNGTLNLSTTSPNSNSGNFNLPISGAFHLSGATLVNAGTLNLNSSLISGPIGTLTNTIGGVIRGQGTLSSLNFSNPGGTILVDSGTTRISPSFSSSGLILLTSPAASLTGGAISSSGTIQGVGTLSNPLTNSGTIEPLGNATLNLAAPLTNSGTLRVSTNNKLLITGPFPTNSGAISLTGGTLDTNNQPLTNNGSITGFGTLATASLTNNSAITLTGGTTTVNGNVINNATKTINILYNPSIFTSPVTNNGSITVTSTTATFAAGLSGNAPSEPTGLATSGDHAPSLAGSLLLTPSSSALSPFVRQDSVTSSGSISIRPTNQAGDTSDINTLTLTPGAAFNLTDTKLILNTTPTPTLRQYLLTQQLFSSTASADPQHRLAIAYATASDLGVSTWGNLPVDPTSTLLKTTYLGDANLDGTINADDYALLDRGFRTSGTTWSQGDFNYDGQVTSADYLLIDRVSTQLSGTYSPSATLLSQRESQFGDAYVSSLLASIPEPSSLATLGALAISLTRRRRH